jgi:glutaredoxin
MIKVYSKPNCTFCTKAKSLLEKLDFAFDVIEVGKDISVEDLHKVLKKPVRSVPQVVIDDQLIGGYNELKEHFVNEKLINFEGELINENTSV